MLTNRPLSKYVLFIFATIITIGILGYYFGTFDQAIHIPFLKKFADPSLYPRDPLLNLRFLHYSYFWLFFIPFYQLGVLEITMFTVYLFTVYLTFWALWRLSKTLFNNSLTSFLTVIVFSIPHIGFAGFPVFEFSLLNRTFVLPFLLISLDLYLNKRFLSAFLLLGFLYNIHVISVNFIIFMFLIDAFLQFKKIGLKNLLLGTFLFVTAALPVLIWKISSSTLDFGINQDWFSAISLGMLYHLFYFVGKNPLIIILTLGGVSTIVLFFIAASSLTKVNKTATVKNFILAAILILLIQVISTYIYPSVVIIQSQIIRVGVFILLFSYLYFLHYLVHLYQTQKIKKMDFIFLVLILIFSVTPIVPLLTFIIYRLTNFKYRLPLVIGISLFFFLLAFKVALQINIWRPGVHIFPDKSSEYDIQVFAKKNTPKDALFIIPPHRWWFYNLEWRVISERSIVVDLSDLLEIAFSPSYANYWRRRFEDIAPGVQKKLNGDVFQSIQLTKNAFYGNTTEDFYQIAKKYQADYLVVEKPHRYNFPIFYENNDFIIYQITKKNESFRNYTRPQ